MERATAVSQQKALSARQPFPPTTLVTCSSTVLRTLEGNARELAIPLSTDDGVEKLERPVDDSDHTDRGNHLPQASTHFLQLLLLRCAQPPLSWCDKLSASQHKEGNKLAQDCERGGTNLLDLSHGVGLPRLPSLWRANGQRKMHPSRGGCKHAQEGTAFFSSPGGCVIGKRRQATLRAS